MTEIIFKIWETFRTGKVGWESTENGEYDEKAHTEQKSNPKPSDKTVYTYESTEHFTIIYSSLNVPKYGSLRFTFDYTEIKCLPFLLSISKGQPFL